jgi:hypothetical protein
LNQTGAISATGDAHYASARSGTLGWTAIEAQCPAPDGKVRFQAGPLYHTGESESRTWLADWSSSYLRVRPPRRHPEEWQEIVEPSWSVINERMQPLRSQLASLDGEQRRENLACEISKKCETAAQTEQRRQLRDRLLKEAIRQNKALECELEKKCE